MLAINACVALEVVFSFGNTYEVDLMGESTALDPATWCARDILVDVGITPVATDIRVDRAGMRNGLLMGKRSESTRLPWVHEE